MVLTCPSAQRPGAHPSVSTKATPHSRRWGLSPHLLRREPSPTRPCSGVGSRSPAARHFMVASGSLAGVLALAVTVCLVGLSARHPLDRLRSGGRSRRRLSDRSCVTTAIALGSNIGGLGERAGTRGELWVAAARLPTTSPPGHRPRRVRRAEPGVDRCRPPVGAPRVSAGAAEYGLVGLLLVAALAGWVWVPSGMARPDVQCLRQGSSRRSCRQTSPCRGLCVAIPAVLLVTSILLGAGTALRARAGCGTNVARRWRNGARIGAGWFGKSPFRVRSQAHGAACSWPASVRLAD